MDKAPLDVVTKLRNLSAPLGPVPEKVKTKKKPFLFGIGSIAVTFDSVKPKQTTPLVNNINSLGEMFGVVCFFFKRKLCSQI